MINLIAQETTRITRPLFPPLVHDENTKLAIILVLLPILLLVLYRTMRHFNE